MKGFEIFNQYQKDKVLHRSLLQQELAVFNNLRQIVSAGANLDRVLEHREKYDIAFISAFRTGDSPDAGGYGKFREGEQDSKGNIRKEGEDISKKENRRMNKKLSRALQDLGYGFIQIKGNYDTIEESYCVINAIEDSEKFAERMLKLAIEFQQDSVLIDPVDGTPYLYYANGSKKFAETNSVEEFEAVVDKYYSQLKGRKFGYEFKFSNLQCVIASDIGMGSRCSLSPVRQGMSCLIPLGARKEIDSWQLVGSGYDKYDPDQSKQINKIGIDFMKDKINAMEASKALKFLGLSASKANSLVNQWREEKSWRAGDGAPRDLPVRQSADQVRQDIMSSVTPRQPKRRKGPFDLQ